MPGTSRTVKGSGDKKKRTRKAIVDATIALMRNNTKPTINEIATAANVSRRTVYMYFPTLEQLWLDATVGSLSESGVDDVLTAKQGLDPAERIERLASALMDLSSDTLQAGRTLITLAADPQNRQTKSARASRGYRRVQWIEDALGPLRAELGKRRFERLVSALVMVLGWEAMIALTDIRGLSIDEQRSVVVWTARTLVEAALRERTPVKRAARHSSR